MIKFFKEKILISLISIPYILGLTIIFSYVLIQGIEDYNMVKIAFLAPNQLLIAGIILILVGIIGIYLVKKRFGDTEKFFGISGISLTSFGDTLKVIGLITIIPGFISLLIRAFGRGFIEDIVKEVSFNSKIIPLIADNYLKYKVPHIWALTLGYIVIGFGVYFIGDKLKGK